MKTIKVVFVREDLADSSTYEETVKTYKVDAKYFDAFTAEQDELYDEGLAGKERYSEDDLDEYKIWLENNKKWEDHIIEEVK